jgi:ABC-type bacteriocin/lantibiotic exporter with double-glycine peptidase domain
MNKFLALLKNGLSRTVLKDRIGGHDVSRSFAGGFGFLKPHLKRHWMSFIIGAVVVAAAALVGFAPPLLMRFLVDQVIMAKQLGFLVGVVSILAACVVFDRIIGLVEKLYFARLEQRIITDIQDRVLRRLLRLPQAFFDEQQTGYLTTRITTDIDALRWLFSSSSVRIMVSLIRLVGGVMLLIYLQWVLALGTLMALPALVWLLHLFSKKIYALAHLRLEKKAQADAALQQTLSANLLVKAFANEEPARRQVKRSFAAFFQSSLDQVSLSSLAELLINLTPSIARGIALVGGSVFIIQDQWTLGGLLAFIAYLGFVFGPVQYLASANLQLQQALAALTRVVALFNSVPEECSDSGINADHLSGDIQFNNVDFAYNEHDVVLKDINLRIQQGERIAVVGPSGVGKSSLVSLLLRFYRETRGSILYDGRAADEYNVRSLRRRIGYVSQQPQLLSGTIMENICYGDSTVSPGAVEKAAIASGIHGFVNNLPDGYETILGENGLSLSEGQRQRLSLARALVKNPDILILDEPTASLDPATEQSIVDSISQLFENKTVFIVSHSRQVVQKCDRVILLDTEGRAFQGTHEKLIQTNTLYQEMFGQPLKIDERIKNYHESTKKRRHEINNINVIPS